MGRRRGKDGRKGEEEKMKGDKWKRGMMRLAKRKGRWEDEICGWEIREEKRRLGKER